MSKDYIEGYIPQKHYALIGQKALVINDKKQILFLKRSEKSGGSREKWDVCGGGLDKYEDPIKGIKREIEEESGLKVKDIKPLAVTSYNEEGEWVLMIGYQATAVTSEIELSWEHDEYIWKSIEETADLNISDFYKELISNISLP